MFSPKTRVGAAGEFTDDAGEKEVDDKKRFQYLAVLQYLQSNNFMEAYVAFERETGVQYVEGALPAASVLEASLDMFASYNEGGTGGWSRRGPGGGNTEEAQAMAAAQEALSSLEGGTCCTGPQGEPASIGANVTAVSFAAWKFGEMLALVASADKKLKLIGSEGEVLAECQSFSSPLLKLQVGPMAEGKVAASHEVLAVSMGGEVSLLRLARAAAEEGGSFTVEVVQRFRDHSKHVTGGWFAPIAAEEAAKEQAEGTSGSVRRSQHFFTVSRDHTARLYTRGACGSSEFAMVGVVRFPSEVTSGCWCDSGSFVLAVRDDNYLRYFDVSTITAAGVSGTPKERVKTNMNALGDSVVSFAVLDLAMSPAGNLLAACTDKSRVILLQPFTSRQLRNLYGAVVEEYDTPSVCFSLDGAFVYTTSSLPQPKRRGEGGEEGELAGMCGQVAIFEVKSGDLVLHLPCHTRAVRCMHRHPYGEALVTGSFDKMVRYWG